MMKAIILNMIVEQALVSYILQAIPIFLSIHIQTNHSINDLHSGTYTSWYFNDKSKRSQLMKYSVLLSMASAYLWIIQIATDVGTRHDTRCCRKINRKD